MNWETSRSDYWYQEKEKQVEKLKGFGTFFVAFILLLLATWK